MISKKEMIVFGEKHRILLQANEFICLLPHPNLRKYILNYNITFPTKDPMPDGFTTMPSGCAIFVIEHDKKNLCTHLAGPTTRPYIVGSQTN